MDERRRPYIGETYGRPFYVTSDRVTHLSSDGDWSMLAHIGNTEYEMLYEIMFSREAKARIKGWRVVLREPTLFEWCAFVYTGPTPARSKAQEAFVREFNARFMPFMRERLDAVLADRRWRRFFCCADGDHALAGIIAGLFHT